MSSGSVQTQFKPIGFGLARQPDSACTDCGTVVLHEFEALHERLCPAKQLRDVVQDVIDSSYADAPTSEPDLVNHPPHYNAHPTGIECIDIVEHFGFNIGNAIKYLWREGLKENSIQDLQKAGWYVQREIERRTRELEWRQARTTRG